MGGGVFFMVMLRGGGGLMERGAHFKFVQNVCLLIWLYLIYQHNILNKVQRCYYSDHYWTLWVLTKIRKCSLFMVWGVGDLPLLLVFIWAPSLVQVKLQRPTPQWIIMKLFWPPPLSLSLPPSLPPSLSLYLYILIYLYIYILYNI